MGNQQQASDSEMIFRLLVEADRCGALEKMVKIAGRATLTAKEEDHQFIEHSATKVDDLDEESIQMVERRLVGITAILRWIPNRVLSAVIHLANILLKSGRITRFITRNIQQRIKI